MSLIIKEFHFFTAIYFRNGSLRLIPALLLFSSVFFLASPGEILAQKFSRQDSLKGSITAERAWWDLKHYNLEVTVDPEGKFISGSNMIRYEVLESDSILQVDLQEPMIFEGAEQGGVQLDFSQEGNAYFVRLAADQETGSTQSVTVRFKGKPVESINPPWDGGFVWSQDRNKKHFVANAVQALGPSSWFPSKDHPYDEPDEGVDLLITVPSGLSAIGNGRLVETKDLGNDKKRFHWRVTQPINGYGINVNVADYSHFEETYKGKKGVLSCDYYVLSYNLEKAKEQFKQVPMMFEAFEHWFGPYPFYEDGYKLVEVPYLGMEHQSSVTYGNGYENGYLGRDLSSSGWGLKFDFIIIHESAHEWFANSITNKDVADMWIHEGFTNYSEVLYLDYHYGTEAGNEYLLGIRELVRNDSPVIGEYDVDSHGSSDMYSKGASIIHTLRQMINDDEAFRQLLRDMNEEFYHKTVSSLEIEQYIADRTGLDLEAFFDQYLRTVKIPKLQYKLQGNTIRFRFRNVVSGFHMPLRIFINEEEQWIHPSENWQELTNGNSIETLRLDENFFVKLSK